MNFLIRLIVDIMTGLFKHEVGDETYSKVKKAFTIIFTILSMVIIGYLVVLYLLFSGYEEEWFILSLNYI